MGTDRQEEIESPSIEDFLDCDQLVSDSDGDSSTSAASPRRALQRLQIHVDMASAQYLAPAAHPSESAPIDGLPICSSGPQTVAFSTDLDPYSAVSGVSSFNYPAAADPSLLTPVSSAPSPPLQQRQAAKRNYPSASQAPTPPNSSKMYYDGYGISSGRQSPSPMTVNPAATEAGPFDLGPYMAHSPPLSHHPSSPKSDIPPPIDPYLGHFTVSGANDGEVTHHTLHEYHPYGVDVTSPGQYLAQQQHVPVGTPHMHHRMPSNGGGETVLTQPHPPQFRPHATIEDLRDPSMLLGGYAPHGTLSPGRRPPPRKRPSPARKSSRTPKTTPHIASEANGQFKQDGELEELTLRDDAPEDDKLLFQLRKKYLSEKGKGMWEDMKTEYQKLVQGNWEKAALQMKVTRAVAKYGVWPEKELERLKEAYRYIEEMRYQLIISHMKENGGCRVWDWKPGHIELMLVKLGLEEPTKDERTGARRRRKAAARRNASPQNGAQAAMGEWGHGLGLQHSAFHGHAQYVAAQAAARHGGPVDVRMGDHFAPPPNLTPAQEEQLVNEVFNNSKSERSLSPDESMDGISFDNSSSSNNNSNNNNSSSSSSNNSNNNTNPGSRRPSAAAPHELSHHNSDHGARGACQQMVSRSYGQQ